MEMPSSHGRPGGLDASPPRLASLGMTQLQFHRSTEDIVLYTKIQHFDNSKYEGKIDGNKDDKEEGEEEGEGGELIILLVLLLRHSYHQQHLTP